MRHRLTMLVFCLGISIVARAENQTLPTHPLVIEADRTQNVSKDSQLATGHVVIRSGATEIRTDKAKIVTGEHQVTVYTDSFTAVAQK